MAPEFTDWTTLYADYVAFCDRCLEQRDWSSPFEFPIEAIARLAHPETEDVLWISAALREISPGLPGFVSVLVERVNSLADVFLEPLVDAGVNEVDPGNNKVFVRPAVKFFGVIRVKRYLYQVFETGTPFQQAGALNAMYWVAPNFEHTGRTAEEIQREAEVYNEARRREAEELTDDYARFIRLALTIFVTTADADVRRSLFAHLSFKEEHYSEELRPLVRDAMRVAVESDDDYIRACLERAAGLRHTLVALPMRKREDARRG